jgi:hypothetical protein
MLCSQSNERGKTNDPLSHSTHDPRAHMAARRGLTALVIALGAMIGGALESIERTDTPPLQVNPVSARIGARAPAAGLS